jgi:hypothetical protein
VVKRPPGEPPNGPSRNAHCAARRLAEMSLGHLLHPSAERLGVRCRQGQWWLLG